MKTGLVILLLGVFAFAMIGCGDSGTGGTPPDTSGVKNLPPKSEGGAGGATPAKTE